MPTAVRPKLKPAMSAPLVIEPATSKWPVLPAKRSHHHVSTLVAENDDDDDEAVPPEDEVSKTRNFGPWGRVLAYFCLALAAVYLRAGHVKAPVAKLSPRNVASIPVQPRRWRLPGVKLGRSGLLVAGAAARPVLRPVGTFFTRRPILRKIGGFVARAGISNTAMRGLRKVLRRAIPVLKTR